MVINFSNATSGVTILSPAITWVKTYTAQISYKLSNGESKNVIYTGMASRGDVGYVYSLWTRSAPNTAMQNFPEVLSSRTVSGTQTDEYIPLMFLLDCASTDRWLPIQRIELNMYFAPAANIFFAPSSPAFIPNVTNYYLEFPSGTIDTSMPKELYLPDPRRTFINIGSVPVGTLSLPTTTIAISGKPLAVFYYFLSTSGSTTTTPGTYNLNPNPYSVTNYHQIVTAGHPFPPTPTYNAVYDGNNNTGCIRHYREFLRVVGKYLPKENTSITFDSWLANIRIYGIQINDNAIYNQISLPLQITLSQPTVNPCNIIIVTQYIPS